MLISGILMLPASSSSSSVTAGVRPRVRWEAGWVRIEGERIAEVGRGVAPGAADFGGPGWVIAPGFVDLHVHLPQFDAIGADGLTLLDWLDRVILPAESRWSDPDEASEMTMRVVRQMLAHGTTSFLGYGSIHHAAARAVLDVLAEYDLRAALGQTMMDLAPISGKNAASMVRPAAEQLAEMDVLLDLPLSSRLEVAVTPRYAGGCSRELMTGLAARAKSRGAIIQTHLAETREELALVKQVHQCSSYTDLYRETGLLTPRTVLGHGIWLDDADRAQLAQTGAVIAHCPTANWFLRSGMMALDRHQLAGVRVGLGSDIGAGYERSMVRVAVAMLATAKARAVEASASSTSSGVPTLPPPTPAEAWWQITGGNADLLGWHNTGRIQPDAEADLLILRPDIRWDTAPDPAGMLLHAWDDRWLRHVLIAGRLLWSAS